MTPQMGDPAPPLAGSPVSGLPVDVRDGRAWVVAFLRGIAGAQARDWIVALHGILPDVERMGGGVVAVTPGPLADARDRVPRWHVRHPVIVDPAGAHRAAWGVPPATRPVWADLDARALRTHLHARVEGRAAPGWPGRTDLPDVLPAAFFVAPGGRVAWAQVARRRWAPLDLDGLRAAVAQAGERPRST